VETQNSLIGIGRRGEQQYQDRDEIFHSIVPSLTNGTLATSSDDF
jgi:hypothetical protein